MFVSLRLTDALLQQVKKLTPSLFCPISKISLNRQIMIILERSSNMLPVYICALADNFYGIKDCIMFKAVGLDINGASFNASSLNSLLYFIVVFPFRFCYLYSTRFLGVCRLLFQYNNSDSIKIRSINFILLTILKLFVMY